MVLAGDIQHCQGAASSGPVRQRGCKTLAYDCYLVEVSSPRLVHKFVSEHGILISKPESNLPPDPGELSPVLGVELLEVITDPL